MELNTVNIDLSSRSDKKTIVFWGCHHSEARTHDSKTFAKHYNKMLRMGNKCVLFLMGDHDCWINYLDRRYDPDEDDGTPFFKRIEIWVKRIKKLKEAGVIIAGIHDGNHEFKAKKYTGGETPGHRIAREAEIPWLSHIAITQLKFSRKAGVKNIFVRTTHGSGGGSQQGAAINKVMKQFEWTEGVDINAQAHLHKLHLWPDNREIIRLTKDGFWIDERTSWHILCGCYYRTYVKGKSNYGERSNMKPSVIGCAAIELHLSETSKDGKRHEYVKYTPQYWT